MKSIGSAEGLAAFAKSLPESLGVPGAVIGVQRRGEPAWVVATGFADVESGREMTVDTPMRIASITKTFTATAVMRLCEDDRIGLDEPLVAHLPELTGLKTNGFPLESLTIRLFLMHRAGIPSDPPTRVWMQSPFPSIDDVLRDIGLVEVVSPPGAAEKYSNLGYALLGEMVARVSGMPYERFLRQSVLDPAGVTSSTFDAPGDRAIGYGRRESGGWPRTIEQELGAERPGGGMWSTAGDLLRWARVAGGWGEETALSPATARLRVPQTAKGDALTAGRSLAWELSRPETRLAHWHDGGVEGYTSSCGFVAAEGLSAVLLTNGHGFDVSAACKRLLGISVGAAEPPPDWTPEGPESPVGVYRGPADYDAWITRGSDGELCVIGPQFSNGTTAVARISHAGDDRYVIGAGRYLGESLGLQRDDRGFVVGFTVANYRHLRRPSA